LAQQREVMANGKTSDEPPRPDDTPSADEGLQLMRAFMKIKAAKDRRKVTELARRLSADA
jgi:hypothetical protein